MGVVCFSESYDNIIMWSHYSDNHKGFCLNSILNMLRSNMLIQDSMEYYVKFNM